MTDSINRIPPHKVLPLPGLHAYAERSVRAGETVHFKVSSTVSYEFSMVRYGPAVDDRSADQVILEAQQGGACPQSIHPGSYVHVAPGADDSSNLNALTIACWVRPWHNESFQGLVTQFDVTAGKGYGLFFEQQRRICFQLARDKSTKETLKLNGPSLDPYAWHHVCAIWGETQATLWVNGQQVDAGEGLGEVSVADLPLRIGAAGAGGEASHFADTDLAEVELYDRVLKAEDIATACTQKGPLSAAAGREGLIGSWRFEEEKGDQVADQSKVRRHGRIINHATWMIGGPRFDSGVVPRYEAYDPAKDPERGHGLRFASDDLYDCRWETRHTCRVQEDAQPGMYAGIFKYHLDGRNGEYHVTFIVRKKPARPKAPILVICSTNTWLAYNSTPFALNMNNDRWPNEGLEDAPEEWPSYSCYRDHRAGQPSYQMGARVPMQAGAGNALYSPRETGYSHLGRCERFTHVWLEKNGYAYDMLGDVDLDQDPEALQGYQAVFIVGHSEYWTGEAYRGLERYLEQGGNLVVLSGNSIFWRASYEIENGIMECRKWENPTEERFHTCDNLHQGRVLGELFHSTDGQRGSLMRECGYPGWKLIGLDSLGWWDFDIKEHFGVYDIQDAAHFLFQGPHKVALKSGDTFGHAEGGELPRAVGHETDARISTLLKMAGNRSVPQGAEQPEEPKGIQTLAKGRHEPNGTVIDFYARRSEPIDDVCAEMVYWERPEGGRVFNAGAVASGWVLSCDPNFQNLLRNVLHHFGVSGTKRDGI
jgi:N,N-dimethylformamidase